MDVSGIGGLAYQVYRDWADNRSCKETDKELVRRHIRAIILELRIAVNLIDLAKRADSEGHVDDRNRILLQIDCPLVSAIAMGLNEVAITQDSANAIVSSFRHEEDDGANSEHQEVEKHDHVDVLSLMVSRLVTVRALATVDELQIVIHWQSRLGKLRNELIGALKSVLHTNSTENKQESVSIQSRSL